MKFTFGNDQGRVDLDCIDILCLEHDDRLDDYNEEHYSMCYDMSTLLLFSILANPNAGGGCELKCKHMVEWFECGRADEYHPEIVDWVCWLVETFDYDGWM